MSKTTLAIIGLILLLFAALLITIGAYVRKDHDNAGWGTIVAGLILLMFAALCLLAAIIYHPGPVNVTVTDLVKKTS